MTFNQVDIADEGGNIHIGLFPVCGLGIYHIQGFCKAEFEPHRHHHSHGEQCRKKIALLDGIQIAVLFRKQSRRIVAFRKADRGGYVACQMVLLHQPRAFKVPPLRTVENRIEAGLRGLPSLFGRTAQGFGDENGIGLYLLHLCDQTFPEA